MHKRTINKETTVTQHKTKCFRVRKKRFSVPPAGNVFLLRLLSRRVKDALPTINLHTNVELKVDVFFRRWATEAAVNW